MVKVDVTNGSQRNHFFSVLSVEMLTILYVKQKYNEINMISKNKKHIYMFYAIKLCSEFQVIHVHFRKLGNQRNI